MVNYEMEVILAVVQPKQNNVFTQEYRPKLYNILLLDHKTASSGEKGKPTKYLPTFPLTNVQEEAGDEVLANLYQLTGGDHVGIKGTVLIYFSDFNIWYILFRYYGRCPTKVRFTLTKFCSECCYNHACQKENFF